MVYSPFRVCLSFDRQNYYSYAWYIYFHKAFGNYNSNRDLSSFHLHNQFQIKIRSHIDIDRTEILNNPSWSTNLKRYIINRLMKCKKQVDPLLKIVKIPSAVWCRILIY